MYIQITTRCNMTCSHCGFNCTNEGEDMSLEVFKAAVEESGESVTIGGGEPTIHPQFWEFMVEVLGNPNVDNVWLATNGAETETAIKLATLAKKGVIGCDLSQDEYHDAIHHSVIDAFSEVKHAGSPFYAQDEKDNRAIRNVTGRLIKSGRATEGTEHCFCEDWLVKPNGDVTHCACEGSPVIGNILNFNPDEKYRDALGECYKDIEEE